MIQATTMRHSTGKTELATLQKVGENQYICEFADGIKCKAIFNIFTGLFYADDKYELLE